jgi:hypothetical protein
LSKDGPGLGSFFTAFARLFRPLSEYRNLSAALASNGEKTMLKRILLKVIFALLASTAGGAASAATIDTFFVDYNSVFGINFTGTVEQDGLIQLTDLTDIFFTSFFFGGLVPTKPDVTLFSYNTAGGASSLNFIVSDPAVPVLACGGASIALFAPCNAFGRVSTSATLMIFISRPLLSFDLPTITLLSSSTVPEPPTWAMLLVGFAGIGFVGAISRRRGARLLS